MSPFERYCEQIDEPEPCATATATADGRRFAHPDHGDVCAYCWFLAQQVSRRDPCGCLGEAPT